MGAGQLRGSQSLNADERALWRQPDWCDMPSLELIEVAMSLSARELSQLKKTSRIPSQAGPLSQKACPTSVPIYASKCTAIWPEGSERSHILSAPVIPNLISRSCRLDEIARGDGSEVWFSWNIALQEMKSLTGLDPPSRVLLRRGQRLLVRHCLYGTTQGHEI